MQEKYGNFRILMLNSSRGFIGGVEKLMISMANLLKQNDWLVYGLFENTVSEDPLFDDVFERIDVHNDNDISKLIEQYKSIGIDYVCIHKTERSTWICQLRKHFKTVVIVHDHDYYCLRRHKYFPVIRKNCHLPFSLLGCSTCSGLLEKRKGKIGFLDLAKRYSVLQQIRKCDLSFVLSDFMKQNLIMNGWDREKIRLLIPYQPISPEVMNNDNAQPVILYVGQLIRGKGVDLLLHSLSAIEMPYVCRIIGQGNDRQYLEALACHLKLRDKIEFIGWVSDLSGLYAQSDIVVVPSRWQEPFGLVGLEAFAHRKPVIAFNNGGISQWLKHKVNGLLVLPNDSNKLSKAIKLLLKDRSLQKKYGDNGYDMVYEHYNYQKYADSLIQPLLNLSEK